MMQNAGIFSHQSTLNQRRSSFLRYYELHGSITQTDGDSLLSTDYTLYPHLLGQLYTPLEL
jgi:hypothetical protein